MVKIQSNNLRTKDRAFLTFIALITFILSQVIAPFHVNGDQVHYSEAYEAVKGLGLYNALIAYRAIIYSFEPIHFLVSWTFANIGLDKTFAMSIVNATIAALAGRYFLRRKRAHLLVLIIVFSNHYLYTAFFTLEKFKIALLFLMLSLNYQRPAFAVIAALAHLQIALLIAVYLLASFLGRNAFIRFSRRINIRSIASKGFLIIALAVVSTYLSDYASSKLLFYLSSVDTKDLVEITPAALVGLVTLLSVSKERAIILWYYALLIIAIMLLGGDRINMYALFGFLYFGFSSGKTSNQVAIFYSGFLISALYFGYKSYKYLHTVINFGG